MKYNITVTGKTKKNEEIVIDTTTQNLDLKDIEVVFKSALKNVNGHDFSKYGYEMENFTVHTQD
jgi:hypothetical protein